jgi:hypothetical protein
MADVMGIEYETKNSNKVTNIHFRHYRNTYCDILGFHSNATVEWCVIVVFPHWYNNENKCLLTMRTKRFHDARNNGSRRNNGFVQRYKNVNESITIDTAM